jgi:hypothetical protein
MSWRCLIEVGEAKSPNRKLWENRFFNCFPHSMLYERFVVSKNHEGSLGYQMMKALQGIFRPGASRHLAKKHRRDLALITGISTMRCNSADVHQFARFIREHYPEVKDLPQVTSEMALAFIDAMEERGVSG